ncbi:MULTISPECIES: metalloprotease PmbA [unclassified Halomonas]|uniref:metalloprotease PmbA n=1 Tax=unclassified Halomonas TaxID=2609666 RepID=UPI0021E4D40E|nr:MULTISPECIES: metalloprotease PmbA [unclassified Halomonas]UYF98563.1 metalloprotease PmbA [Halomonas sp. GD1P12]WNL40323.1 metalloprotease PmbA [Halomonas sp. PAMB 3232]WNL43654.1 metalloprotease PmbA [Halomonas sp. PAMB 3264]
MAQAFDAAAQQQELVARAEEALALAKKLGADQAEVGASVDQGLSVSVRLGEVETVELSRDQGIAVTLYVGSRKGSASSSDASSASIKAAVEKALSIARYTGEDPAAGLAEASLMATHLPDLDVHHPWALDTERATELALACERAGSEVAGIHQSEGASLSSGEGVRVYANSHGFVGTQKGSSHSLSCMLIAQDEQGMQRDFDYTSARDPRALRDPQSVGREAARRTLRRLGAKRPPTGTFPVLFDPSLASGLVGHLMGALAGGALYREASFLCDKLGEPLFPEWFNLEERPLEVGAMASSPFDGEGVQTRHNRFIEDGRIASYMLSSYSARRLGMTTTGNAGGARNIRLEAPQESLESLLARMGRGVLVTELMGQGVNSVTGDYSRGAAGFWVENGQIQYPVEEFTIAGNLMTMFKGLQALGDDIDTRGSIHTGSWLVDAMTVAGD